MKFAFLPFTNTWSCGFPLMRPGIELIFGIGFIFVACNYCPSQG
jgi:hypothetical protein